MPTALQKVPTAVEARESHGFHYGAESDEPEGAGMLVALWEPGGRPQCRALPALGQDDRSPSFLGSTRRVHQPSASTRTSTLDAS